MQKSGNERQHHRRKPPLSYAEAHYQESLRIARKRVKDIRSFYISASMYAVIIDPLGDQPEHGHRLWAQWATIGWGSGSWCRD